MQPIADTTCTLQYQPVSPFRASNTHMCCMISMCMSVATVAMGSMRICSGHLPVILWIRSREPACELRLATGGDQGGGERAKDAIRASSPHAVSTYMQHWHQYRVYTSHSISRPSRLVLKLKDH